MHGRKLTQRLGADWGLAKIGMFNRGVIWNNSDDWARLRKVFDRGGS